MNWKRADNAKATRSSRVAFVFYCIFVERGYILNVILTLGELGTFSLQENLLTKDIEWLC